MALQLKVKRVMRLEKNCKRLGHNGLYRNVSKQIIETTFPPSKSEIEQYLLEDILETDMPHNQSAFWLWHQIHDETYREQQWPPISGSEVTLCLKRMGNWEYSGPD